MSGEPRNLAAGTPPQVAHGEACITCGDLALPLRVVALGEDPGLARCAAADGGEETVEVSLFAPVTVGERLLVHAGTAIARLEDDDPGPGEEA